MALCKNCFHYDKEIDEFKQLWDDCDIVSDDQRIKHHCLMYDDKIPMEIYYENSECPFFEKKDLTE